LNTDPANGKSMCVCPTSTDFYDPIVEACVTDCEVSTTGTYGDSITKLCTSCHDNCLTCTDFNYTNCLTCANTFYYYADTTTCDSICPDGKFKIKFNK